MSGALPGWSWAAARAAGVSHLASGKPCEDATATCAVAGVGGPVFAAAVSDGAGSARFAREGARAVARGVLREAERWFGSTPGLPDVTAAAGWLDPVRAEIAATAAAREAAPRDFAATLVAAFATADATLILHVGDGAAVVDGPAGWEVASWPAGGEYAGATYFVTDDAGPKSRATLIDRPIGALALFSDGIESLVLDPVARRPLDWWFDDMIGVVRAGEGRGRDAALCRSLRGYLRRPELDRLTHDDKSLILAVRR